MLVPPLHNGAVVRRIMRSDPDLIRRLSLSDEMLRMVDYVAANRDVDSITVAKTFNKKLSTVNAQLRDLCRKRYLQRTPVVATGGGLCYLYRLAS